MSGGSLPGAEPYAPDLKDKLERAIAARGLEYRPRTHHLAEDGAPRFTNRLASTSSCHQNPTPPMPLRRR